MRALFLAAICVSVTLGCRTHATPCDTDGDREVCRQKEVQSLDRELQERASHKP